MKMQHSPGHVVAETALILFIIWLVFLRKTEEPGKQVRMRLLNYVLGVLNRIRGNARSWATHSVHPLLTINARMRS